MSDAAAKPLRIALAGLGTVGAGVLRLLETNRAVVEARAGRPLEVVAVSARDRQRDRGVDLSPYAWCDDMTTLAERDDVDVVVDMVGGPNVDGLLRCLKPGGRFVIVGFAWKLILSPIWGIAPGMLDAIGLKSLFAPWLGREEPALTTLALISVWQFVGIPMMLIYAALLSIPDEILEAGECDGVTGFSAFWKIKLPLILPSIGIISILTFVANFNAFDLIYATQGALAGPDFSTDILGTFMFRTFFGFQLQLGDPNMGAAIATAMFGIILIGVCIYLFGIQRRLRSYQF